MQVSKISIVLMLVALSIGCTHMQEQPLHTIDDYQNSSKYALKAELNLTEELKSSKYEHSAAGDTWIIPLGENLTHNSEVLLRSVFSDVYLRNNENEKATEPVDIIITPKLVSVEQSLGMWKWSESILTIALEWYLTDTSGTPLWVDTVKGTGKSETGNLFTGNERTKDRVKMALEELFNNSYHALESAKIIRDIDSKKRKEGGFPASAGK